MRFTLSCAKKSFDSDILVPGSSGSGFVLALVSMRSRSACWSAFSVMGKIHLPKPARLLEVVDVGQFCGNVILYGSSSSEML